MFDVPLQAVMCISLISCKSILNHIEIILQQNWGGDRKLVDATSINILMILHDFQFLREKFFIVMVHYSHQITVKNINIPYNIDLIEHLKLPTRHHKNVFLDFILRIFISIMSHLWISQPLFIKNIYLQYRFKISYRCAYTLQWD